MVESIILTKSARKLQKGQEDVPGRLTVTDVKLEWKPVDKDSPFTRVLIPLQSIKSMFFDAKLS